MSISKVCYWTIFIQTFARMRQFSRRPGVLAPDPLGSPGTSGLSQQCGVCPGSETEQWLWEYWWDETIYVYPTLFRGSGNCGDEMNIIFIMKRVTNNFYKELDSIYLRSIILRKQENCLARVLIQNLGLLGLLFFMRRFQDPIDWKSTQHNK